MADECSDCDGMCTHNRKGPQAASQALTHPFGLMHLWRVLGNGG
jgi:hypothetical protein